MIKEWFSAQELAGITGLPTTDRGIVIAASRDGWKSRKKPIGKGREYHINSLPEPSRIALIVHEQKSKESDSKVAENNHIRNESLWMVYDKSPSSMKNEAKRRVDAINLYESLISGGLKKGQAMKATCEQTGNCRRTVYEWLKLVESHHRSDWLALLLPRYSNSKKREATCTDDAWEFFKSDYLRLEKPDLRACYIRLKRAANEHDWSIPAERTLSRWIKERIPLTIRILMRDGEHALMRRYPPQERSVAELHALQWINGDGYAHNVFVKWPDGTIERPKTWFWQDIHSRRILAYRVDTTEHTDQIRLSFGDVVEQYGLPDHATIDNTRAAANKWMTGGVPNRYRFKVKEDDPLGLFPSLGIKVHWTSVFKGKGHGQAKPIERAFGVGGLGEYVDKHPAFSGAYTGPNPMAKPENYNSTAIDLAVFLEVLNQEIIEWNARPGRRTEMGAGKYSFDDVFNRSYANAPIRKASTEQRRLWLLSAEAITVKQDGSFTLEAGSKTGIGRNRYFSHDLIYYGEERKKIVIRFDPYSLHETVYCYTLDGRFICDADILDAAGFGDTHTSRVYNRNRKQFIKAQKEAAKAEMKMDTLEVVDKLPAPTLPDPVTNKVSRITPNINNVEIPPQPATIGPTSEELAVQEDVQHDLNNILNLANPQEETDKDRYRRWHTLDQRVKEGGKLEGQEAIFYRSFPQTPEFETLEDLTEMGMFKLHGNTA